ncbi:Rho-binding antiterminator [uncultured Shewanella sp.]|uniref:Rho-binding antiterminator n=1 Tax=Shewanella atlantica TaxID=271099 RepID=UPI002615E5CB|nr:Rho-binding antiterminator [uncultured Shewanella sp.]
MIRCDIHDYIEIACLYRIELLLTLRSGEEVVGVAKTTCIDDHRKECIVIESGGESVSIVLDSIKRMTAVTENPHFNSVNIS